MDNRIKVSVYCLAYNHSAYIEQTINGFLSQKTDFRYEVIIHDDASPDKTAEIIKKYENEYPDIIKGIYQTKNQYSQRINITRTFVLPQLNGEYVCLCEGDDFWTDPYKLQKQVDVMDEFLDCHLCVHRTSEVNVTGEPTGVFFPNVDLNSGIIESKEFLKLCSKSYSFHTSSYMFRMSEWCKYIQNPPKFKTVCDVGDEPYLLYFGQLGKVYYINDVMSSYRRGVSTSWSNRRASETDINKIIKHPTAMIETYLEFDKYTNGKYHNLFLPKTANMKLQLSIFTKSCKRLLNKAEREYFKSLPVAKRVIAFFGAIFPDLLLTCYLRRLKRLNKRKGYL